VKNRLFQITYAVANVSLIAYGLMAAITPAILLEPFSVHVYKFPTSAIEAVRYLSALFRLQGYFNLLLGALGLLLLWRWRVRSEPWVLRTLIGITILSYLGPVVFDNTVGTIGLFEVIEHVVFLAALVLGFVMIAGSESKSGVENG
jgi:hypothetical protein